jgi:transcriptional regulator with XRE-family HTH domain
MTFKPFACGLCGASVKAKRGPGRTREYRRGLLLPVPDDFPMPTCTGCGEEYMSVEQAHSLDAKQAPAYAAWQAEHVGAVVQRLKSVHHVTLRQIEAACGVTGTYLSHVLAGRKEASASLIYLLEAYAASPAEFQRRLTGGIGVTGGASTYGSYLSPGLNREPAAAAPDSADAAPSITTIHVAGGHYGLPSTPFAKVANDVEAAA